MSIGTFVHALLTDLGNGLAAVFLIGSMLFLWATWRVLRDDLDLSDGEETSGESAGAAVGTASPEGDAAFPTSSPAPVRRGSRPDVRRRRRIDRPAA